MERGKKIDSQSHKLPDSKSTMQEQLGGVADHSGSVKPIDETAVTNVRSNEDQGEGIELKYSEVILSNTSSTSSGSSDNAKKSAGGNNDGEQQHMTSRTATTSEGCGVSFETFEDSYKDADCIDDEEAVKCLGIARALCILLTIIIILALGTGIGFVIFPRSRFWALVVCLPVLVVAIILWISLMCLVSSDNADVVIEPSNLPEPNLVKSKTENTNDSLEPTVAVSDVGDSPPDDGSIIAEAQRIASNIQQSIEESKDYVLRRIVLPATTLCRPASPCRPMSAARSQSFGARPFSALSRNRSLANSIINNETDEECCTDVWCLRDENGVVNLTGKYKLVHNENFDVLLKALDIPALFRRAANAARPVHKYTHDGDTFRVQIEGIIKGDTTFTVNGPPTISTLKHFKFLDYVSYLENKDGIVVRKVAQNRANKSSDEVAELIVTRKLSKSGKKLYLISEAIQEDGVVRSKSVQTFLRI